ncbi:MAG: hypothetical protein QXJ97_12135 [Desulfurococcaceae archaeon]
MKVLDKFVHYAKNIRIVKLREDEYTVTYMIYYLSEKIGIIEIRSDYAVLIEKIKKFIELMQ